MDRMRGADPDELHDVSQTFRRGAVRLHEARAHATAAVRGLDWRGADADRFREAWEARVRLPLDELMDAVERLGEEAARQAEAQRATSSHTASMARGAVRGRS